MQLQEVAALVELPALSAGEPIRTARQLLLRAAGAPAGAARAAVPDLLPARAAAECLQLLVDTARVRVPMAEVAAALAPGGTFGHAGEGLVSLDALAGLVSLLAAGPASPRLQLAFWALDTDDSGSLSEAQLLGLLPAAQLASGAARLLLGQAASVQSLASEAADPRAQAAAQQRWQVLREVLTSSFREADPARTGQLLPGEQLSQLLFSVAAQLTALMVGAVPAAQFSIDDGSNGAAAAADGSTSGSGQATPPSRRRSATPPHWSHSSEQSPAASQAQAQAQQQLHGGDGGGSGAGDGGGGGQAAPMRAGSSGLADVVVVDEHGSLLHYQAPVADACAAAVGGRAPAAAPNAELRVYTSSRGGWRSGGGAEPGQRAGLSPATSLVGQLELLGNHQAPQQQQQQQQQPAGALAEVRQQQQQQPMSADVFLSPGGTLSHDTAGSGDRFAAHPVAGTRLGLLSTASSGRRRSTLSQQAGGNAVAAGDGAGAGAPDPAPEPALTTAATLLSSVQTNIAAAVAKVLVHCGVCFLLIVVVVLGDAALVAGLHLGAGLSLAASFGITTAANLGLLLCLLSLLVGVRLANRAHQRTIAEVAAGPGGQKVDLIISNLNDLVQQLKSSEQPAQAGGTGPPAHTLSSVRRYDSSAGVWSAVPDPEVVGASGVDSGAGGAADKLRTLWSVVGRVAGFLPPADDSGASSARLGHSDSLNLGAAPAGLHAPGAVPGGGGGGYSSGSGGQGASSGSGAVGSPAAGPAGAVRPSGGITRQARASGAPFFSPPGVTGPAAIREAYA